MYSLRLAFCLLSISYLDSIFFQFSLVSVLLPDLPMNGLRTEVFMHPLDYQEQSRNLFLFSEWFSNSTTVCKR